MNVVTLEPPGVGASTATFRWTVRPETELYRRTSFTLALPDGVDARAVPEALWWRVAIICLHAHWALLRPCRVVLPVRLGPGEREFWLRMIDAQVASLEVDGGGETSRSVEIVEAGPPLAPVVPASDSGQVTACFSGGRDSLVQLALLQELGETPLLVTTTSPREGSVDHDNDRRRQVHEEVVRRRGVELVEVTSDLRECVANGFSARYHRAVTEMTDAFLFFAAALVVAQMRGAARIFLASEAEVQETARLGGAIIQHRHLMYSAVTQRCLEALVSPAGSSYGGLTYPLLQFQVQRLLATRYADLRDLQYSCWEMAAGEQACGRCVECQGIAFNVLAEGVDPREIGIDLATVLEAARSWRPGGEPDRPRGLVGEVAGRYGDEQRLRAVRGLDEEWVRALLGGSDAANGALQAWDDVRASALEEPAPGPEPGYRAGYLAFVDESLREGLQAILDQHFAPEPTSTYADLLRRSETLAAWISAPLGRPQRGHPATGAAAIARRPPIARPPAPVAPTAAELTTIGDCLPDPEPTLRRLDGERVLHVAETALDGNEQRYLSECVTTNWVSSAGPFVRRFEEAFAEAAGCRFAVSCSSGTAALHLMLAAAGIGPGDEVILPTFTMVATANAVGYTGAKAVFIDSDPDTWNLDVSLVAHAIGPRTRAILAVHTYGQPVDVDALSRIAHDNGLVLLEDAAEAHGAELRGRRVGGLGKAAAFSFYGNKILTTGEGGIVTTDHEELEAVARELRDHGFSAERHFWHRFRAFNYRMSNLQAAVGLAQVERLDELVAARRRNDRQYRDELAGIDGIRLPPDVPGTERAPWVFGVLVEEEFGRSRDELRRRLAAEAIETRTFFVPLHLQPAYMREHAGRRHPVAERLCATGLYLPSSPSLGEGDIARVAAAVRRAAA